jgi:hypothetical protein
LPFGLSLRSSELAFGSVRTRVLIRNPRSAINKKARQKRQAFLLMVEGVSVTPLRYNTA